MIRSLYRWKSFWLGLFVLVFLGWAWIGPENQVREVIWVLNSFHQGFLIEECGATVTFWHGEGLGAQRPGFRLRFYEVREEKDREWFPEAFVLETNRRDSGVTIAHWFLTLLFLVPWSGLLAWRWRKIKRLSMPGT